MGLNHALRLALVFSIYLTVHFTGISGSNNSYFFVPCKPGWYLFGEKCYKILGLNKPLSWFDSRESCSLEGGLLASIHSYELQEFLTIFLLLNSKSNVWIGLQDMYLESDFSWEDNSEYNFTNWDKNEPFELFNLRQEDCVEMRYYRYTLKIGTWNDASCDDLKPFICQADKNEEGNSSDPRFCSCEDGGGWEYLSSCYHIIKEEKSWEDAEKYCEENFKGYLVTILDKKSELFLNYILGLSSLSKNVWIGIKIENYSIQKWISGWHVVYKKLDQEWLNFVNDSCVLKSNRTSWAAAPCLNKYPFICEKQKDNVPVLKGPVLDEWKCPNSSEKWIDLGGESCYYIETKNSEYWFDANDLCGRMGGKLASFHSEHEANILHPRVLYTQELLLIGLRRKNAKREAFVWADGTEVIYQNWKEGEPNDIDAECGVLDTKTMKWSVVYCEIAKGGYICKSKKVLSKMMKEIPAPVPYNFTASIQKNFTEERDQIYSGGIPVGTAVGTVFCTLLVVLLAGVIGYHFRRSWMRYFAKTENDGFISTAEVSLGHVSEKVI